MTMLECPSHGQPFGIRQHDFLWHGPTLVSLMVSPLLHVFRYRNPWPMPGCVHTLAWPTRLSCACTYCTSECDDLSLFVWCVMRVFFMPYLQQKNSNKIIKPKKSKYMVYFLPHPCLFISWCYLTVGVVFLDGFYKIRWHFYCDIRWTLGAFPLNLEYRGGSYITIINALLTINAIFKP